MHLRHLVLGNPLMSTVVDSLANRSSEEKKQLLAALLRELVQQSSRHPITIQDDNGELIGLFSPVGSISQDDFFVEGSSAFYRELEQRRLSKKYVSAEEAIGYLQPQASRG